MGIGDPPVEVAHVTSARIRVAHEGARNGYSRATFWYAAGVKRVLLTGMSGTGKSTVIGELATLGYKAIDTDADEWSDCLAWYISQASGCTPPR
jgi:putative protein kinase ArgK-like GTPase of G3E family